MIAIKCVPFEDFFFLLRSFDDFSGEMLRHCWQKPLEIHWRFGGVDLKSDLEPSSLCIYMLKSVGTSTLSVVNVKLEDL